jgi:hypothetical protein
MAVEKLSHGRLFEICRASLEVGIAQRRQARCSSLLPAATPRAGFSHALERPARQLLRGVVGFFKPLTTFETTLSMLFPVA